MAKGGSKALTGILCFIFGFLFAIIVEVAVIAAGVYFLMSADIDKIMSTVGVENTDADGNKIYINTNVEEGGVQKVTDLVNALKNLADKGTNNLTLGDFTKLFPVGDKGLDKVYSSLASALSSYNITEEDLREIIDEDELKATPFSEIGSFLSECGKSVRVDTLLSVAGIDVQSSPLYLNIAYGPEAAVILSAEGNVVLYKDTFTLSEGTYTRTDGTALPAELSSYLEESAAGGEYYMYYCVSDSSATVAAATDGGYQLTEVPYTIYSAEKAELSGGYYYDAEDKLVVLNKRTLGEVTEGENGMLSVLDDVYVTDILDKNNSDELIEEVLGGITIGDLLNGNVSFEDKLNTVCVPTVIDVTAEDAIMMYVGYSITDVKEAQGADYNYTGTINFYTKSDSGEWSVEKTATAYITAENGTVKSVYYLENGSKVEYKGVSIADIGTQTANITSALKVKDVVNIEDGDRLMEKLGEYTIADIGSAIDELYLSDFLTEVRPDDSLLAYMVYGINNIFAAPAGSPEGVACVADYHFVGEDGTKTVIKNVFVVTDADGFITEVYYIENDVKVECFTTINGVNDRIDGLMDDLKLGEIIEITEEDGDILNALKDSSINSLADDLNALTLQELFTDSIYGEGVVMQQISEEEFSADYIYYEFDAAADDFVLVNGTGKVSAWSKDYYTYGKAESVWSLLLYTDGGEKVYGINDITALQGNVVGNLQTQSMYDFYDMGVIGDGSKTDDTWVTLSKTVVYDGRSMQVGEMTLSMFIGFAGNLISAGA